MKVPTAICRGLIVFAGLALASPAQAAPITFDTALPVSKGEYVAQEELVVMQSGNDPTALNRDFTATQGISVLGYGITGNLVVFGMLPYGHKSLSMIVGGQSVTRQTTGLGDLTLLARYTAYERNGAGRTFRLAPLLGVTAATGSSTRSDAFGTLPAIMQPGSGAWSGLAGAVMTQQTTHYEFDSQLSYRHHGTANAFRAGDELELDASFQYRLLPKTLQEGTPNFLYGVLETNLVRQEENVQGGSIDPNSGGTTLYLDPGLQYVTTRWVAQLAFQIPVSQQLNGTGLGSRYVLHAGIRVNM